MPVTETAVRFTSPNMVVRPVPVTSAHTSRMPTVNIPITETEMRTGPEWEAEQVEVSVLEMTVILPEGGNLRCLRVCGIQAARIAIKAMAEDMRVDVRLHDRPIVGLKEDN